MSKIMYQEEQERDTWLHGKRTTDTETDPVTAEYQSSALAIIVLVIGAIQMSKIEKVVIKLCNLFRKRVKFSSFPNCM